MLSSAPPARRFGALLALLAGALTTPLLAPVAPHPGNHVLDAIGEIALVALAAALALLAPSAVPVLAALLAEVLPVAFAELLRAACLLLALLVAVLFSALSVVSLSSVPFGSILTAIGLTVRHDVSGTLVRIGLVCVVAVDADGTASSLGALD